MLGRSVFWIGALLGIGLAAIYFYYNVVFDRNSAENYELEPTRIRCLVGGPDDFWKMVIVGAEDAAKEFNAELDVFIPESLESSRHEQTTELTRTSESLYDGLMLSPLDPETQTRLISSAAAKMFVVTFDNEAPAAIAHYHVGANNKLAGQLVAELIQEAIPEGGEIALFVGDITRETARIRRQVLINTLAGHAAFDAVSNSSEERIEAGDYTIVDTYLDDRDPKKAKENATKALQEHPNLKCLVGLYSKNGPACVEAVKKAGRLSDTKIVAFDQLEATLEGIRDGNIVGTVVQDPFSYGFESVRLLCDLHKRKDEKEPSKFSGHLTVSCQIVDSDALDDYETGLKAQLTKLGDK